MKTRKSFWNILISIVTIITLLFPNVSVAATTLSEEIKVKLVESREDNNSYSIGDASASSTDLSHIIWNMVKENDESASVYCMNAEKNGFDFTNSFTESDYASYDTEYDLKVQADKTTLIQNVFNGTEQTVGTNYSKLLALFDLLYIPEDTTNAAKFKSDLLKAADVDVELTDASIKAIQQAAIWYFANNSEDIYKDPYDITNDNDGFATWLYVKNKDEEDYNAITDYYEDGYVRQEAFGKLYTYLIDTANANAGNYSEEVKHIQEIQITDDGAQLEESGNDFIYGPFNISKDNTYKYGLNLKVNDSTDYTLLNESKEEVADKSIDNFTGNKFYVKVSADNIETVGISVTTSYTETLPKLYTSSSEETVLQPIAMLTRVNNVFNFSASESRGKRFDLALRKYIIALNGDDLEQSRVPNIDKSTLSARSTGTTTAIYKHRKDPIVVEKDDLVTYRLTIYNEGEKAGRATELIDQLPTGLEFSKVVSGNFELANESDYDKTTNRLKLTRKTDNTDNLEAYNEQTKDLKSEDVDIECKVTYNAAEEEKVLTNVAWISKEYNAEDNKEITTQIGEDRDSEPQTTPKADEAGTTEVTKDNIENYKGHPDNSDSLYDSNTYYKGWQDDDDFEKLVLNPASKYNFKILKTDQTFNTIRTNSASFKVNGQEYTATNGVLEIANNVQITAQNVNNADTYEITEIKAPDGYDIFDGKIVLKVYKTTNFDSYGLDWDRIEEEIKVFDKDGNELDEDEDNPFIIDFDENDNLSTITLKVKNSRQSGVYEISTIKVDDDGELIKEFPAVINIKTADDEIDYYTIEGVQEFGHIKAITLDTLNTPDEYIITEAEAPENYEKFTGSIKLSVYKKIENGVYCIDKEKTEAHIQVLDKDGNEIKENSPVTFEVDEEKASIVLTLKNTLIPGHYNVNLVKEDEYGEQLDSKAVFEVNGESKEVTGKLDIAKDVEINRANVNTADVYVIKELKAPDEYCEFDGTITLTVNKKVENYKYVVDSFDYKVKDKNGKDITNESKEKLDVHLNEDGNLYVEVKNYKFDLKLIKRIIEVNGEKQAERIKSVDVSKLNTKDENGNVITTADYKLEKDPVSVKPGDIVTYSLRVYNEGYIDGFAAEISEDIPEGLEFILTDDTSKLSDAEKEAVEYNNKNGWTVSKKDANNRVTVVTTNALASQENLLKAFGTNDGTKTVDDLDYREITIKLKVVADNITKKIIRNEACISKDTDKYGDEIDDRDSTPEEWKKENSDKYNDENQKWPIYKEDDEDYDNILLEVFDLALRKFIIEVEGEEFKDENGNYTRAPEVDTSNLNTVGEDGKVITTAIYNHPKDVVEANVGDTVVYVLRVYNEGEVDGYATEIKDHLPEYLEFVEGDFNTRYKWDVSTDGRTVTTTYLSNQLIAKPTTNSEGKLVLSYKDVPIMCKVKSTAKTNEAITNIADITKCTDRYKKDVVDRDSTPDNVELPSDQKLPSYKDSEKGSYIPGQEDDDDFEKVVVKPFDLALRKFITEVTDNNKVTQEVTTRIPNLIYDKESNHITYDHTKEPVDVVTDNVVTYTIRVFNEGEMDGFAAEITDDIPDGLEYLPENDTNKEYRWIMKDSDGNETTDVSKAVKITTDYLSKEQGEARMEEQGLEENPAYLKAFNPEFGITGKNPDYADVKVAFKVIQPNTSSKIIINSAQISEDTDKHGNPVNDIDSIPGVWNEGEDDQDKEYLKLSYFDLALRKWVTQAILIENGEETVTNTGHDAWDDPEEVVKVELKKKKLDAVTVKFRYSIRVYNQGDIEGYAKEITDYIPQGLKFLAEDNPNWVDEGNNIISTRKLENTLLKPGEYADVEVVLTWINGQDNIGLKVNTAEISEDYNERGVPDIDSTPDNKVPGEDDIDDAPVLLSIATGRETVYVGLGLVILVTLAGGIILIKKKVL